MVHSLNTLQSFEVSGMGQLRTMGVVWTLRNFVTSACFPWERCFEKETCLHIGVIVSSWAPIVVLDAGAAPWGLGCLRNGVKKLNCENPRETERPEHWKKKRASGLKRLRRWARQEVGRRCCSQDAHGNQAGKCCGECVWKKGFHQAINICFFEVL